MKMLPRSPRPRSLVATLTPLLSVLVLAIPARGTDVLHVDDDAAAGGDGLAWSTAYRFLQDALAAAGPGSGICEVRVAGGVYLPDRTDAVPGGTGSSAAGFALISDVAVMGGFAGIGAVDPDDRDIVTYESILSGDLNGDDLPGFVNNGENSLHVTRGSGVIATAVLDGFTITGGNADVFGGGMLIETGDPTVRNCLFVENIALGGGAVRNLSGSPAFVDCVFRGNVGTVQGGGVHTEASTGDPLFIGCAFLDNSSIDNNSRGGGMWLRFNGTLMNCIFSGNSADFGGGINVLAATALIVNCTFNGNTATNAAATTAGGAFSNQTGDAEISNCILWGNAPDEILNLATAATTVSYSDVQGGWAGLGNINADPLFEADLSLDTASPAIDAGSNALVIPDVIDANGNGDFTEPFPFDFAGADRMQDGNGDLVVIVDMGAYEAPPDCNGNGVADDEDIENGTSLDCNGNGVPDECDIAIGTSPDCNGNGVPDECDITDGTSPDCNANGVPDECDIAIGTSPDCNDNGIPDECDIADGTSPDCNLNGIPDECENDDDEDDDEEDEDDEDEEGEVPPCDFP